MTRLLFEAPSDLSVGRVRISGEDGLVKDWVATPDSRHFSGEVKPGFYAAEISPVGVPSESVVFRILPGAAREVAVPTFSWLQANVGNVTFLDIDDQAGAIKALFSEPSESQTSDERASDNKALGGHAEVPPGKVKSQRTPNRSRATAVASQPRSLEPSSSDHFATASSTPDRRLSVGLSIEGDGRSGAFSPFAGRSMLDLADGRLQLIVNDLEDEPSGLRRIRLSVSIESDRTQFLFLPVYRGGVLVTLRPSAFSTHDVDLEVTPRDPAKRALARILVAGAVEEARVVCPMETHLFQMYAAIDRDPFEAMLLALLSARFPSDLPPPSERLTNLLIEAVPWSQDAYVLAARQRLHGAEPGVSRTRAALDALDLLRRARRQRRPYFAYSNRIFAELIEALVGYFETAGPSQARRTASKIHRLWRKEQVLQADAGASFSWLKRDPLALGAGFLAPDRKVSGRLALRSNNVIFSGRLSAGRVQIERASSDQTSRAHPPAPNTASRPDGDGPPTAPSRARPPGPEDDPNLGRFGGQASSPGYRLEARFTTQSDPKWVSITLTVIADASASAPGAVVWFCLHPTFDPQWVRIMLINGRAELNVDSWGGFTVGVWIPHANVELELNLAEHPEAPSAIRDF